MSEALARNLAAYLAETLGADDLIVTGLARIPGGASRETYRFRARYSKDGKTHDRALILRRDPASSLIETERANEFRAYRAFHALNFPVPEPIALELDGRVLERPFFVMEEIGNCEAASILASDPYGAHRQKIGERFWRHLGTIARADPEAIGLGGLDAPRNREDCWDHEVARWERVILEDEREPQPIAHAAIRWLKRNPPAPAKRLCVVHGDYRSGNFLSDADGNIRAILDWEMAHLGDPLEDIGWALDPLWSHGDCAHPAGTIAREDGLRIWEEASGTTIDREALARWEIFASLKGLAIWISAAREYAEGHNTDPVNAFSGWYCLAFHNKVLAERLGGAPV